MSSTARSLSHVRETKVVPLNAQAGAGASSEAPAPAPRALVATSRRSRALAAAKRQFLDLLPPVLAIGAIVGLWELLCAAPDASLPPPSRVISETWELIVDPFYDRGGIDKGLFWHIYASVKRVALGYLLASLAGIALGVLVGSSKLATRALDPIFQVLRTIPPLAWLPLSLAAFRDGQPSAIFVIFITAIWPIIINTAVGIRNIPQDYQNVAKVLRLNRGEYFISIMLPAAAPFIFTGLRIGVGLSWLAIVAGEMLIGGVGIGFFIWDSWNSSRISDIIIALLYVGLVGLLLDRAIAVLGRIVTRGTAST
ncbi:MAG TPA: nitrate ABC transporter permease [Gammaproteobacteria bacterium]|nr:nitrate ABC transporter permease [Gammaproteobacteria bacterium]